MSISETLARVYVLDIIGVFLVVLVAILVG